MRRAICLIAFACALTPSAWAADQLPSLNKLVTSIDLSGPFSTRSAWTFTATQAPDIVDPTAGGPPEMIAGAITLCLSKDGGHTCDPRLVPALHPYYGDDIFSETHFLPRASIEYPSPGTAPRLVLQAASIYSVDGDQLVATRVFAYDRKTDGFIEVFRQQTGRNNNQEIRYMTGGPLRGAIVSAEPTDRAPYSYWITVNRISAKGIYKPVLRYRSVTGYADGNPLGVIDSEMPNLLRHLGKWKPGQPLPLPDTPCDPHLVSMELWCR